MPTRLSFLGVALSLATTSCASAFQLRMAVGGDVHKTQQRKQRAGSSATAPVTGATHQTPPPVMDSIRTTTTPPTNLKG